MDPTDEVTPIDLTGCTAKMQIRAGAKRLITVTLAVTGATGTLAYTFSPAETRSLPATTSDRPHEYGIELTYPSGIIEGLPDDADVPGLVYVTSEPVVGA